MEESKQANWPVRIGAIACLGLVLFTLNARFHWTLSFTMLKISFSSSILVYAAILIFLFKWPRSGLALTLVGGCGMILLVTYGAREMPGDTRYAGYGSLATVVVFLLVQLVTVGVAARAWFSNKQTGDGRRLLKSFLAVGIYALLVAFILLPPGLGHPVSRKTSQAVGELRSLCTCLMIYQNAFPDKGFPNKLIELEDPPISCLNMSSLTSPERGYDYVYTPGSPTADNTIESFTVTARAFRLGHTGYDNFFMDETCVIRRTTEDRDANGDDPAIE